MQQWRFAPATSATFFTFFTFETFICSTSKYQHVKNESHLMFSILKTGRAGEGRQSGGVRAVMRAPVGHGWRRGRRPGRRRGRQCG